MSADFLTSLEEGQQQTVNISYNTYPESFFSAEFNIDQPLQKTLTVGVVKSDDGISIPGDDLKEVKKLSIRLTEGEDSIEATLTKQTTKSLLLVLNQIYKNLGE